MTEDEAKTKICPFIRMGDQFFMGQTARQVAALPMCIGSQCMMWKFNGSGNIQRHGYCGLAGKP